MPDVAKFSVTAHQVSGTTDYLTYDLNDKIRIAGRIPPKTVWDYIKEITESANREILLISLLPTSKDEKTSYLAFYNYLKTRDRYVLILTNLPFSTLHDFSNIFLQVWCCQRIW